MKKIEELNKKHFTYLMIFFIFLIFILSNYHNTVAAENNTIIITKEDIINAKPVSPYPVKFSIQDLKAIEIMEKRHFTKTYPEFSDNERLKNLEYELLGRIWQYTPQEERIKKLKIASSNVMLSGVALPALISSKRNAKRMSNTSVGIRKKDSVGLFDGFLRLKNPELYEKYRQRADEIYYKYER